jgi:hypothetical protein
MIKMESITLYDVLQVALQQIDNEQKRKDIEICIVSPESKKSYSVQYLDCSEVKSGVIVLKV